ncbi:MAG: hypothetical protein ACFFCW_20100 [Candidatus Hodarchaeota archaeon]
MKKVSIILHSLRSHELTGLVIIGILLRLALMPYFSDPYDLSTYCSSLILFANGYNPYAIYASLYPPFIYFILFPLFNLAHWIGLSPGYNYVPEAANTGTVTGMVSANQVNPSFLVLWKLPHLSFDLLTGLLIYRFVKELTDNPKMPKYSFVIWFFNPFTLAISYFHGAFDVIVAFFILLGTFLIYNRKYFSAGLSFGLGTLTKLSPIYVGVPLAVMILVKGVLSSPRTNNLKADALDFSKFAAGLVTPLLLFASVLIEYFQLMFFGVAPESSVGGLNQWFIAVDPRLSWQPAESAANILQKILLLYPVIILVICLLLCRFLRWNYGQSNKNILFAAALFTCLTYLFLPVVVQPQYLLWILPLLVVLSTIRSKFLLPLGMLSIAGLAFYLSIQGPYAVLYPLAIHTPLYTAEQVSSNILYYMNRPGVIAPFLRQDLLLLFGGTGFLGQLITIYYAVKSIRRGA